MTIYETVTNRLIEAMESGCIPWRQPWKSRGEAGGLPYNHHSGKQYRGINIWLLACAPLHPSRCDRKDGMNNFFGDHLYSKEELVAEFAAAFLCAECGISNEYTETNNAAYLQSWIRVFKNDSKVAISAAQRAQKACDFILGRSSAISIESEREVQAA